MAKRLAVLHRRRKRAATFKRKPCRSGHKWRATYFGFYCLRCLLFLPDGDPQWDEPHSNYEEREFYNDDDEYDYDEDGADCLCCGGDGWVDGYENDPLWYSPGELERCSSCNGSGRRKDMTSW